MWLAGRSRGPAHQHHCTFEGDAYLLMAKFVDHFLAASSSFDLRTDDQFWHYLQVRTYFHDTHTALLRPETDCYKGAGVGWVLQLRRRCAQAGQPTA